jgi:hypothetical protein
MGGHSSSTSQLTSVNNSYNSTTSNIQVSTGLTGTDLTNVLQKVTDYADSVVASSPKTGGNSSMVATPEKPNVLLAIAIGALAIVAIMRK